MDILLFLLMGLSGIFLVVSAINNHYKIFLMSLTVLVSTLISLIVVSVYTDGEIIGEKIIETTKLFYNGYIIKSKIPIRYKIITTSNCYKCVYSTQSIEVLGCSE